MKIIKYTVCRQNTRRQIIETYEDIEVDRKMSSTAELQYRLQVYMSHIGGRPFTKVNRITRVQCILQSWNSTVSLVTRLWAGQLRNYFISGRRKEKISCCCHAFTPLYAFMVCTGTALLLHYRM
jgi:hypothetical protein